MAMLYGAKPPDAALTGLFCSAAYQAACVARPKQAPPRPREAIDLDPGAAAWPSRDQRYRNTCVAFAATAALELFRALRSEDGALVPLSPDFLYNRMRTGLDPVLLATLAETVPDYDDGATLFAQAACVLRDIGCCSEAARPYLPASALGNLAGEAPSETQTADAAGRRHDAFYHNHTPRTNGDRLIPALDGSDIRLPISDVILDLLALRSPVAVGLPVFRRSDGRDNWTTPAALRHGLVPYPGTDARAGPEEPEGARIREGHAVCITGFRPDPEDPEGGWFTFRNSWGIDFRTASGSPPGSPLRALRPGYGYLSCAAADKYVWEMLAPTDTAYTTFPAC